MCEGLILPYLAAESDVKIVWDAHNKRLKCVVVSEVEGILKFLLQLVTSDKSYS